MSAPPRVEGVYLPMLAKNSEPFHKAGWSYERKYDGMRAIITCKDGETLLTSRTAMDLTHQFPEFKEAHRHFPDTILDGEIVVFRKDGTEDLEALQLRMGLQDPEEIAKRGAQYPASLVLFDVLETKDANHLTRSYINRRATLQRIVGRGAGRYRLSQTVAFTAIPKGWEGIVAKENDSLYFPGKRRATWKKWKVEETIDCFVTGWTEGKGDREGRFGALRIAIYDPVKYGFIDIGLVGSGFSEENIELIDQWIRDEEAGPLVVEVEYMGWTKTHKLREPRFLRIRYDKRPKECTNE